MWSPRPVRCVNSAKHPNRRSSAARRTFGRCSVRRSDSSLAFGAGVARAPSSGGPQRAAPVPSGRRRTRTGLHEGVQSVHDMTDTVRQRTATIANVGHMKLGGPANARDAAMIAIAGHVEVMVGSVVEMGIGTAAGLHLAASLPALAGPSYLSGWRKYGEDVASGLLHGDGLMQVPREPGLGMNVDEEAVKRLDARGSA